MLIYCIMKKHISSQTDGPARTARHGRTKPVKRILVVDEEPDLRLLNSEVLSQSGYQVDAAADGLFALQALKTDRYDLVIVEQDLSTVTGLELVKALRSQQVMLPAILVTGNIPAKKLDLNPWLKVQAVLFKPYTVAELIKTVKHALVPIGIATHVSFAPPSNWQSSVCSRWVSALKM